MSDNLIEEERSGSWRNMPPARNNNGMAIQIIASALATIAIGLGSWTAQALVSLRVDVEKISERLESNVRNVNRLEEALKGLPVRVEFEGLRADMSQLRTELRDLRDDLRRRAR